MDIKVLPKSLRAQISAEYNISSVVHCIKQLVINSLEAKSTSIAIRFNLNSNNIQIIDNGSGFTKQNLHLIGVRYATSKYQSINESENNQILFPSRGIAIPDIITLSKTIKILTKTATNPRTFCKIFEHGKPPKLTAVKQRPSKGTTISIYSFLFNKPVRNKSSNLDNLSNEIEKEIKFIAIRNPSISFSLRNDSNGSIVFQIPRTNFIYKSILMLYGNIKTSFKKIKYKQGNVLLSGLVNTKKYPQNILQLVYLNRRFVKDSKFHKIMEFMLAKSTIDNLTDEKHHYFIYVINIDCPYTEFDVIDYNELEVVFKNFEEIIKCMTSGLYKFLMEYNLLKEKNSNKLLNGSPISEQDPKIRVSQVDGIVRGIPTKRKLDLQLKDCENKIQKLNCPEQQDEPKDMFCRSVATYGPDNQDDLLNKVIQTNTVKFSTKAIQTLTDNFDDFIFKKPLPPKTRLVERKTELIRLQINKSALDLFKHQNNNNPNKTLHDTCSKLKSRIYQEHFINKKYSSEMKKLQVKNRIHMGQYLTQNSLITQPQNIKYKKSQYYIPNGKHHLSLFRPILRRNKVWITHGEMAAHKPFKFNCEQQNVSCIYNLNGSIKFRKYYDSKHNDCIDTKYIYTNNNSVVSENMNMKFLRQNNCEQRKNILGLQLSQLLPHFPQRNNSLAQINKTEKNSRRCKRFKSDLISIIPRSVTSNISRRTRVTFNSHLNLATKPNNNRIINDNQSVINLLQSNATKFSFENYYQNNETPITILEQNIVNEKYKTPKNITPENKTLENKAPEIKLNIDNKDEYYCNENYKNILRWLENINNTPNISVLEETIESRKNSENSLIVLSGTLNEINFSFIDNYTSTSINNLPPAILNTTNLKQSNEEFHPKQDDIENGNSQNKNNNIQELLKNLKHQNEITLTPIKLIDPVYDSPISTIAPEIINEETNEIHFNVNNSAKRTEWHQNITDTGTPYYINKRTGMTTFSTPKSLDKYTMSTRQTYLPKGMSPILNTSNVQLNELTPNAKHVLHQKMADTELDELQNVKWVNYFQNNDSKQFFANLYSDKKHFEIEISKLNKLPKKLQAAFDNYTFTKTDLKSTVIINQFDKKFIVAQIKENDKKLLVAFDQHAVHERICLEKLMKDYQFNDKLKSMKCLKSILIPMVNNEIKMLKKCKKHFENLGLFFDILDNDNIRIKQIPICWQNKNDCKNITIKFLILRLIQDLTKDPSQMNTIFPSVILNAIKSEACKSAIKFGDPLSMEQCAKMIYDLSECDLPFQCAHGRPSIIPILEINNKEQFEECRKPNLSNLKKI